MTNTTQTTISNPKHPKCKKGQSIVNAYKDLLKGNERLRYLYSAEPKHPDIPQLEESCISRHDFIQNRIRAELLTSNEVCIELGIPISPECLTLAEAYDKHDGGYFICMKSELCGDFDVIYYNYAGGIDQEQQMPHEMDVNTFFAVLPMLPSFDISKCY